MSQSIVHAQDSFAIPAIIKSYNMDIVTAIVRRIHKKKMVII